LAAKKSTSNPSRRGYQDPHFVEASMLLLNSVMPIFSSSSDSSWKSAGFLRSSASHQSEIQVGAPGYLTLPLCQILEIPTGQVTRAEGDVHPLGNPHYGLIPRTACASQRHSRQLSEMRSSDAAFSPSATIPLSSASSKPMKNGLAEMKPYAGRKVVTLSPLLAQFRRTLWPHVVDTSSPAPASRARSTLSS